MNRAKVVLSFVTILCGFASIIFGGVITTIRAQSTGVTIELDPVATGLDSPLYVTNARDGTDRLFIIEQPGRIKLLASGNRTPSVFLDITSRVLAGGERGLLGLAFHPQFETNRRFFVNYTRRNDGATVIAEYHASASNPDVADAIETVLLTVAQPFANHNGGMIEFGPDGLLYIGMGDGGSANDPGNRAQNINELLGKMLRIDVNSTGGQLPYGVPANNPFSGAAPGRDGI
jgi:glucose/arabinose dehydrogenase